MVLVDTSIWVDHLRSGDAVLSLLLEDVRAAIHPYVIGELACGNLHNRTQVLRLLSALPKTPAVRETEVLHFIEQHELMGSCIGYVDVHLLAAAMLMDGGLLWTRDKRLRKVTESLGLCFDR